MREDQIVDLLKKKYPPPAFATLSQVRAFTGGGSPRTADAIVMGLWPSRGLLLEGFEIKVSRWDWQKELKNPAKAEEIASFCDYWWIVVLNQQMIHDGELPKPWGLIAVDDGKLVTVKAAEKLESKPMDRGFLASIIRKLHESTEHELSHSIRRSDIKAELEAEYNRGREDVLARSSQEWAMLQRAVDDFERISGVKINQYAGDVTGEKFKLAELLHDCRYTLRGLIEFSDRLYEACEAVKPHIAKGKLDKERKRRVGRRIHR